MVRPLGSLGSLGPVGSGSDRAILSGLSHTCVQGCRIYPSVQNKRRCIQPGPYRASRNGLHNGAQTRNIQFRQCRIQVCNTRNNRNFRDFRRFCGSDFPQFVRTQLQLFARILQVCLFAFCRFHFPRLFRRWRLPDAFL